MWLNRKNFRGEHVRLGLPFEKKKSRCKKGRDSRKRVLYIACPARTRIAVIIMAIAF